MTRIVLARSLPSSLVERIVSAASDLEVVDAGDAALPVSGRVGLMFLPEDRTPSRPELPAAELVKRWRELLRDADVLFDLHPAAIDLIPQFAPRLRWVQAIAAGAAELFRHSGLRHSGVEIATARGVHDDSLADFALAAILSHVKQFDELGRNQAERRWVEIPGRGMTGALLCVVGYGSIGTAIAERARSFGVRIVGVRRSPTQDSLAERVYDIAGLDAAIAGADFVVLSLPSSPSTEGLFSAERFAAMKSGAFLVNVGRGSTVDEPALIAALESGYLGGAALDVTSREPLPFDDPLWRAPRLLVSPHCTSLVPGTAIGKIVDVFVENLRRDSAGLPLRNQARSDVA